MTRLVSAMRSMIHIKRPFELLHGLWLRVGSGSRGLGEQKSSAGYARGAHPKHHPAQRLGSALSPRPSSTAALYEMMRRLALAAIAVVFCGVIVIESVSFYHQSRAEAELSEYRMVVYDLANTIRAMRTKAVAQRQPFELRVDQARRTISVSWLSLGASDYAALDRTIWLPEGLEISEAPPWITAQSSGAMTPGSIVIMAPAFRRLFRLVISHRGVVELYEETVL